MAGSVSSGASSVGSKIGSAVSSVGDKIGSAASSVGDKIGSVASSVVSTVSSGGKTVWKNTFGRFFATGTENAPRGLALVGEKGPELVDFRGGERVYNNHNTEKMLANAGSKSNSFNIVFNNTSQTTAFTIMREFKKYNRELAFNGVL